MHKHKFFSVTLFTQSLRCLEKFQLKSKQMDCSYNWTNTHWALLSLYSLRLAGLSVTTYLWCCEVPCQEGDGSSSPAAADTAERCRENLGICRIPRDPIPSSSRTKCPGKNRYQTLVLEGGRCCRKYSRVSQGESGHLPHPSLSLPLSIMYQVSRWE